MPRPPRTEIVRKLSSIVVRVQKIAGGPRHVASPPGGVRGLLLVSLDDQWSIALQSNEVEGLVH